MMSPRKSLCIESAIAVLFLVTAWNGTWMYMHGVWTEPRWVLFIQVLSAILYAPLVPLSYLSSRRRMKQPKADATLPVWRPPSGDPRW